MIPFMQMMMNSNKQQDRENVFHERTSILRTKGYCGFTISGLERYWKGTKVTVRNAHGQKISGTGETIEEACQEIIDTIDQRFDEPH